jgi:hypothetical protein
MQAIFFLMPKTPRWNIPYRSFFAKKRRKNERNKEQFQSKDFDRRADRCSACGSFCPCVQQLRTEIIQQKQQHKPDRD